MRPFLDISESDTVFVTMQSTGARFFPKLPEMLDTSKCTGLDFLS